MLKTTKVTYKIIQTLALATFTIIAALLTLPLYIATLAFGQPIKLKK